MKEEFCMTQNEMDMILAINKDHVDLPVMKLFAGATSKQEKINIYWDSLATKYGFVNLTVEPSSKSNLHFLAEPIKKYKTVVEKCSDCNGTGEISKEVEIKVEREIKC